MGIINNIRRSIGLMQATLLIISSLIIGLAVSSVHMYFVLSKQRLIVLEQANEVLDLAEGGAATAAWTLDSDLAQEIAENIITRDSVLNVDIRAKLNNESDQVLAAITKPNDKSNILLNWVSETYFAENSSVVRQLTTTGDKHGKEVGMLSLELSLQYAAQRFIDTAISYLLISLVQAFLIGFILLKIIEWLVTTPLSKAAMSIASVEPEKLQPNSDLIAIPELHRDNELGQLLDHTNRVLNRLADSQIELRRMATKDALTGLPNRTLICEYLQYSIASAKRSSHLVGVIFLDLDRFKTVNDSLGHIMGDKLLKQVAQKLSECIREEDAIGRLGGDEFLIVMEAQKPDDIVNSVQRIIDALSIPTKIDGMELRATASLGISIYPNDGEDAGTLMQRADLAMYKAKGDETSPWRLFSEAMGAAVAKRLAIENSLAGVLERNEFQLYLQPKFSSDHLSIAGCEALLRWQHRGQWIPPSEFIPVAEDMGLICDIGDWVLEESCRFIQKWNKDSMPIAVNVSASQLSDENFVQRALATVEKYNIEPHLIEFEITETMLMSNLNRSSKRLALLRDRGFNISIDDFGTGYSSLSYLTKLPINALKIDRSFVSGPEASEVILNTVVALGRALDLKIIAEGVETKEQCSRLINDGCDLLQGYYLAKPMPVDQFEQQYLEAKKQSGII